jgi:hypothetical protein
MSPLKSSAFPLVAGAVLFAAILFFWNSPVVYPVKIFTVVLHEMSHGLAAVITGGKIVKIEISPLIGGACYTAGGLQMAILPAGYLGSMFFGCLILLLAARTNLDKLISMIIGIVLLLLTIFFVRTQFGIIFCLTFGIAMIVIGRFAPLAVNDLLLKVIGFTCALYAVIDIKEDLISRTVPGSDAYQMSKLIPLPPVAWGLIWAGIAVVAVFLTVKKAYSKR